MSQSQDNGAFGQQEPTSGVGDYNAMAFVFAQLLNRIQTMTLVRVVAVSNAGGVSPVGTVDVQPLVNQMTGDRKARPHGTIYAIPYMRVQGGADAIILDPKIGDIGACGFCSRDISSVKASKKQANPGSFRTFDWSDGLYFGGFLNGVPVQFVQFSAAGITVKSPTAIIFDAPSIQSKGAWTHDGTLVNNAIPIDKTHTHPDPQGGNTGTPNP